MKQERAYPRFTVTRKAQLSCEAGHPWIYDTEVLSADEHKNGGIADVFSTRGRYVGTGLVSDRSKIRGSGCSPATHPTRWTRPSGNGGSGTPGTIAGR